MTSHLVSSDDRDFGACRVPPDDVDHRAHVRLAFKLLRRVLPECDRMTGSRANEAHRWR